MNVKRMLGVVGIVGMLLVGCGNPTQPEETVRSCVTCVEETGTVYIMDEETFINFTTVQQSMRTFEANNVFQKFDLKFGESICKEHASTDTLFIRY